MHSDRHAWLTALMAVPAAAAIWVLAGVPVATGISGLVVSVFVIFALPRMAATAAVLGTAQGLFIVMSAKWRSSTAGGAPEARSSVLLWLGALFGGALGLLGFVPVYSHMNIAIESTVAIVVLLVAAMGGGAVAGTVCCRVLPGRLLGPIALGRSVVLAGFFVLAIAAVDYKMYGTAFDDKHPIPVIALVHLSAGDGKGSTWSGCDDYSGRDSAGSGGETGRLVVRQTDGALEMSDPNRITYGGGVYGDGRFRAGAEAAFGRDVLRSLWVGRFGTNSLTFTRRDTFSGGTRLNTRKIVGIGQRIPCGR